VTLDLISAGAAKGLVTALEPTWSRESGGVLHSTFGAVGAMHELFTSGAPCDVLILTASQLRELAASGQVVAATIASLGNVRTGIAVRRGEAHPVIADADALRGTLRAAPELYLPDPQRATAGIHFAGVLRTLGIADEVATRLRPFANGATAMRAMADTGAPRAVGCTQVTEILYTEGVELVGPLPAAFELATLYAAAVTARCTQPAAAEAFIALLTGPDAAARRIAGGFEPA